MISVPNFGSTSRKLLSSKRKKSVYYPERRRGISNVFFTKLSSKRKKSEYYPKKKNIRISTNTYIQCTNRNFLKERRIITNIIHKSKKKNTRVSTSITYIQCFSQIYFLLQEKKSEYYPQIEKEEFTNI